MVKQVTAFPKMISRQILPLEFAMKRLLGLTVLIWLAIVCVGCGSSSNSNPTSSAQPANVFVTGEDAPLASVVGFQVTINSITLNGSGSASAQVLSTPTTVDFARLLGLRSPLAFNSVAAGTYTSVTFSLANPVISYVQLTPTPTVTALDGTFNSSGPTTDSVTVNFPAAMVVGSNGLAGLRMEFDIRQSVAVDGNGNITGVVNPTIYAAAVGSTDTNGQVTDLTGGLVSVNVAGNTFLIQGPYGKQFTIDVSNSTKFNSGWNINDLAAPAFVGVQGSYQSDGSIMANNVEVITTSQAFISGRVLAINPNTGPVQTITMWVGETSADLVSEYGTIQQVNVSAVTQYDICFFSDLYTNAFFNNSDVLVGQRIFIGGSYSDSVFTPQMISLRFQGVYGTLAPGSVTIDSGSTNTGTFQLQAGGLIGYSLGGSPLTVATGSGTYFINLTGLSALQSDGAIPLVAGGLLFYDSTLNSPLMLGAVVADPPDIQSEN
jgi:hypothetical protein